MPPRKPQKQRLDQLLVELELVDCLQTARGLILAGQVVVNEQRVDKAGFQTTALANIRVKTQDKGGFVGRGGRKLKGALKDFELSETLNGALALDIGASTGGFTDCLLKFGAKKVWAIELGKHQLDCRLRDDQRVVSLEQVDFLCWDTTILPPIDIVVADLSFTSLKPFAPALAKLQARNQYLNYILLIKPQFEVEPQLIPKGGVVDQRQLIEQAVKDVVDVFIAEGFHFIDQADSILPGARGNQEVFILLNRKQVNQPKPLPLT